MDLCGSHTAAKNWRRRWRDGWSKCGGIQWNSRKNPATDGWSATECYMPSYATIFLRRTLSPDTGTGAPADRSHNLLTTMKNQTRGESPLSETPCSPSSESPGTLKLGEPHPAARDALRYVAELGFVRQSTLMESFSSCAIEGNRFAEVCGETLRRVMHREPVSDRYILGLAWAIRGMDSLENV